MGPKVIIALISGILFVIALFAKPKIGAALVLVSRPILDNLTFLQTTYLAGSINVLQALGIVLAFSLILVCFFKSSEMFRHKEANIYLLFIFLCLPSVFLSQSISEAFADWMKLFTLWAVLVFLLAFIKTKKDIHMFLIVILIASFYPLFRLTIGFVMNQTTYINGYNRYIGGYFHMGPISFMLLLFIPAYIYLFEQSKNLTLKFFCLSGIIYIAICIYFTYYRSALVGVTTLGMSYLTVRKRYITLLSMLIIILFAFLVSDFLTTRFGPLLEMLPNLKYLFDPLNTKHDYLLSGRFGVWRHIFTQYLFAAKPYNMIFGFGYNVAVGDYLIIPHNDYLNFFFQNGFVAMATFIIFMFISMRNGFAAIRSPSGAALLCALIASSVTALTSNYFVSVRVGLYVGAYVAILKKLIILENDAEASPQ